MSEALRALVREVLATRPMPGVCVEVVDRDRVLSSDCQGWADVERGVPVTPATRFEIGSISKSFLSLVVLSLASEGRLGLDDLVTEHLPWFEVGGRPAITLRHLLQHSAGLITGADAVPDDYAQAWQLRHTVVGAAPGTTFHYSNAGYVVLGLVVEAVTGRTAASLVAERVLRPLAMTRSTAQLTHADRPLLATGYQPLHDDRPWLPGDPLVPATWFEVAAADGNVAATAADLGRYLRMLLGRGRLDGVEVVAAAGFAELTGSFAPGGEPSVHPSSYALGINVEIIDGHTCLTHGGGMVGYACFVLADLDAGLAIAVLSNGPGDSEGAELIARRGYDLLRTGASERIGDPWLVADPDAYAGTYVGGGRSFTVAATADGGLTLTDADADADAAADADGSGALGWAGEGRLGCLHPAWRTFHHELAGAGADRTWTYGGLVLRPVGAPPVTSAEPLAPAEPPVQPAEWLALVGHYRSYSPWYTNFRIVLREGVLHLVAAGGVEAARDDPQLVELTTGEFRIGADELLPERLVAGPIVEGRVISVSRDGCVYSRTFTA